MKETYQNLFKKDINQVLTEIIPVNNSYKDCDTISNLELTTIKTHNVYHARPRKMVDLVCHYCGKSFKRERRQHVYKNRAIGRTYCDRMCMSCDYKDI